MFGYRLAMLISLIGCAPLVGQPIGDVAPNKAFLASWNMPPTVQALSDFRLPSGLGRVLLLDWFGVY
ncbi:hypothetical protein ANRL2_04555 [Anaerolineae bacterium]|nr:hypothetical protein ANRL2_04555 [Anaerolineae bacterium]